MSRVVEAITHAVWKIVVFIWQDAIPFVAVCAAAVLAVGILARIGFRDTSKTPSNRLHPPGATAQQVEA